MSKRLIILGGGGHGRVIADLALRCGFQEIAFLDDAEVREVMGFPVLGKLSAAPALCDGRTEFIIGIGNNAVRRKIARKDTLPWATLIHPSAQVGYRAEIGEGTVILANAVVNPCARVGRHCIINTGAIVEHDNLLEDYVHISPGAVLGGTVHIGESTHIGLGAVVRNNLSIIDHCVVGAGAAVIHDLAEPGIYVGVPAEKMRER